MKASKSSRNPRKILAGVSVLAVAGASVAIPALAATDYTYNPFDTNNGFTVVARGNAELSNGELEGSIAAFGSIAALKDNYPIRHQSQGSRDYTVPLIDGDPVRILAGSSVTEESNYFSITNENATAGTNEANASAKLVDTTGLELKIHNQFPTIFGADGERDISFEALKSSTVTLVDVTAAFAFVNRTRGSV